MHRAGVLLAWVLAGPLLAASPAAPAQPAADGAPGCRYTRPEGWQPARALRWSGGCSAGLAEGRGVLLGLGGADERFFYGRMTGGRLDFGVVEIERGYLAGRFEAGRLRAGDERGVILRAFDEASAAARELGERYRDEGNAASARFYFDKARQLAAQMD